jgi:PBP1b-binding outer membrane lipoprotein LpoB
MKKSIGIILLAAIILTGCQKKEISQQIEQTPKVLDRTLQSGETSNINEKFLNPPEIEIASWETYFSYDCPN